MGIQVRRSTSRDIQFGQTLTSVRTQLGLKPVDDLFEEIMGYTDELLGRCEASIDSPYLALLEVATAYYCRAQEIDMLIHEGERKGVIAKGSPYYKFRTGELRSFFEIAKRSAELGSRRLSAERLSFDQREVPS